MEPKEIHQFLRGGHARVQKVKDVCTVIATGISHNSMNDTVARDGAGVASFCVPSSSGAPSGRRIWKEQHCPSKLEPCVVPLLTRPYVVYYKRRWHYWQRREWLVHRTLWDALYVRSAWTITLGGRPSTMHDGDYTNGINRVKDVRAM